MPDDAVVSYDSRSIETLLKTQLTVTLKTQRNGRFESLARGQPFMREAALRALVDDIAKALLRSFEMAAQDPVTGLYFSTWDDPKRID